MKKTFRIEGKPPKKGRPRVTTRVSFAHAYNTKDTIENEQRVKDAYLSKFEHCLYDGPVLVKITAYYAPPASWSKPRKERAIKEKWKMTRPDIDNIEKSILDGLNEVAFRDDGQVVDIRSSKRYGKRDYTVVTLEYLGE